MYDCLFVELFVFYLNHLRTPTGIYPENFVKIGLDLAEIYRILKNVYLFVCLFVCLLNCLFFILIILGHPQEYTLKNFAARKVSAFPVTGLFVCLLPSFFILIILGHPQEYTLKILQGYNLIWLRYPVSKKCLFVCLLICLFFILIILEHPQECTLQIS